jgi:hypothetical protein
MELPTRWYNFFLLKMHFHIVLARHAAQKCQNQFINCHYCAKNNLGNLKGGNESPFYRFSVTVLKPTFLNWGKGELYRYVLDDIPQPPVGLVVTCLSRATHRIALLYITSQLAELQPLPLSHFVLYTTD